jgi:hypothetical protein
MPKIIIFSTRGKGGGEAQKEEEEEEEEADGDVVETRRPSSQL